MSVTELYPPYQGDMLGRPRRGMGKRLPVPWIMTEQDGQMNGNGWLSFVEDKCMPAHLQRLCQVCGEPVALGQLVHMQTYGPGRTHGPGVHPRCGMLTFRVCPHFEGAHDDEAVVAWLWEGEGQGYELVDDGDGPYASDCSVKAGAVALTATDLRRLASAGVSA